MKLGDIELFAVSDGTFGLDGGQMFGIVPKVLWEKQFPADERNRVRLSSTSVLVCTHDWKILIDSGMGDHFNEKSRAIYALARRATLLEELTRLGLSPDDIDIVINTHLHFDHCGWNTRREGNRVISTFPRARYFIQRGEWEHALAPSEREDASFWEETFLPIESQAELIEGDVEILPGIRVEVQPGHTQNMQCVEVKSGGEVAYFLSDLVPTRAHLSYAWSLSFDLYPQDTLNSKKALLPRLIRDKALVIFPHDPQWAWAKLQEVEGKIIAVPVK